MYQRAVKREQEARVRACTRSGACRRRSRSQVALHCKAGKNARKKGNHAQTGSRRKRKAETHERGHAGTKRQKQTKGVNGEHACARSQREAKRTFLSEKEPANFMYIIYIITWDLSMNLYQH